MSKEPTEFDKEYSEKSFWEKIAGVAKTAGIEVIEKALLLYYTLQEDATPAWAKATIIGALGYFISLVDAVPDLTPMLGYTDDLGVLVMALTTVTAYINDNVRQKTQEKLDRWFGDESTNDINQDPNH